MIRSALLAAAAAAALLTAATAPSRALALESAPVRSERATATLISDTDAVQPGKPLRLGLRLRMAPGWHTYWQNPGDAGERTDWNVDYPSQLGPQPLTRTTAPRDAATASASPVALDAHAL